MDVLISRQVAIDALEEGFKDATEGVDKLSPTYGLIKAVTGIYKCLIGKLPSAQPEQHLDEWCTDCKEYDKTRKCCPRWNKVIKNTVDELKSAQPEQCEDAVSRKAVKDGFVEMCSFICPYTEKQRHIMCGSCLLGTAFDVLEATQPVTPKQRTGKWIKKHRHYGGFRSYTGFDAMGEQHTVTVDERTEYDDLYCSECGARSADNFLNFCPNCGAKMEGDTE